MILNNSLIGLDELIQLSNSIKSTHGLLGGREKDYAWLGKKLVEQQRRVPNFIPGNSEQNQEISHPQILERFRHLRMLSWIKQSVLCSSNETGVEEHPTEDRHKTGRKRSFG